MPKQLSSRPSKKRKIVVPSFGAPSEADDSTVQSSLNNPSSSALSMRSLPLKSVPALTTLCARVFVENIAMLSKQDQLWTNTLRLLKRVPDALLSRLFSMLRASCPRLLSHAFIVGNFLQGNTITLTNDLTGVNRITLTSVAEMGSNLQNMVLSGFAKHPDALFASIVSSLPSLRVLVLCGCTKVGSKTIEAAAKSCPRLTVLNVNFTSVPPVALVSIVSSCPELEVLKLAGIQNWTDATFSKFLSGIHSDLKLLNLRTLKLRQTSLSDVSLNPLLVMCPNLKRLDLSFTPVRRLAPLATRSENYPLEKLSLTSTQVSSADILAIVSNLTQLKSLSLGALGGGQASSMGNSSAMTMDDEMLKDLTEILEQFQDIENINIVGNTKLGNMRRSIAASDFIARVGRKCKTLNLSSIPSLRSHDLVGLMPEHERESLSPLRTLILNHTNIDDDAAAFISSCTLLETLEIAGTRFTKKGLFDIVDSCVNLEKLDLTSCRSVSLSERRRFFEVWKEESVE